MMINPYNANIELQNFPNLDANLLRYYDRVFDTVIDYEVSPRYLYESGLKVGFRDMFYYIDQLYNCRPTSVIDVGCGECVWKNWFPNIIGFDPNINEFSKQDFVDFFDQDFSTNHTKWYDCGMALNSLHYIDWNDISAQLDRAMNIVKKQFLFTFNFRVIKDKPNLPLAELIPLFNTILESSIYEIKLLDYPSLRNIPVDKINDWAHINGDVRFILAHATY